MSGVIAQATASYGRIREVLDGSVRKKSGTLKQDLTGNIEVQDVTLTLGGKNVLKDISFTIKAQSRTAILGPTSAGKTELLYLMTGLITPTTGTILFDKNPIETYDTTSLYEQIGLVFQDSVLFNLSIRENIAFSTIVTDEALKKAIDTAELRDFIDGLPAGLDTVVSERGTSLSGGQKQRIMLARALAITPKILFLDDFTARLDVFTEKKILQNVQANYPELTLISVTQKIEAIKTYDQIILLME